MAPDPASYTEKNPHSFNRYAYGNNNPYRFLDPDGREAFAFGDLPENPQAGIGTYATAAVIAAPVLFFVPDAAIAIAVRYPTTTIFATELAAGEVGLGVPKGGPLWSTTKNKSAVENALGHWNKHKGEFPELQNAKQYAERAKDFLTNPPKGTLTKTNSRGDTLRYDPGTNTFGVLSKDGAPRTMFRPKDGMDYWNRQ